MRCSIRAMVLICYCKLFYIIWYGTVNCFILSGTVAVNCLYIYTISLICWSFLCYFSWIQTVLLCMDHSFYLRSSLYMIIHIKNDAGSTFEYTFEVRFPDSCLILVAVVWIIIPERLLMVGLILYCWKRCSSINWTDSMGFSLSLSFF